MKERQILFNGPMVRAILDGTKTQTRRVILKKRNIPGEPRHYPPDSQIAQFLRIADCPYGVPGDRLWVRETFVLENCEETLPDRPFKEVEDGEWGPYLVPHYRATEAEPHIVNQELMVDSFDDRTRWSPSIHMPRWASRISLEITGVRVEQVQAISEDDAKAEGCDAPDWPRYVTFPDGTRHDLFNAREGFQWTWDSLYAKRGVGWDANPWVWIVEFKVL